ncbi:hypothetical protein DLAC_02190 [Tieghemostelium lacteum]|uniref:AAA+ ATPase domain-containing protein n=1 Tax=Tieghemostelium lacteum TaxID=361077 RepID=A0A152A4C2_TIELA|nr:hypothetical protein DLAC_02190 [Tieghemostelium lacteum]|eukprot:KYR01092.1 hypothetical protein DLAC_02190 [Tieghemostelium lacteum]
MEPSGGNNNTNDITKRSNVNMNIQETKEKEDEGIEKQQTCTEEPSNIIASSNSQVTMSQSGAGDVGGVDSVSNVSGDSGLPITPQQVGGSNTPVKDGIQPMMVIDDMDILPSSNTLEDEVDEDDEDDINDDSTIPFKLYHHGSDEADDTPIEDDDNDEENSNNSNNNSNNNNNNNRNNQEHILFLLKNYKKYKKSSGNTSLSPTTLSQDNNKKRKLHLSSNLISKKLQESALKKFKKLKNDLSSSSQKESNTATDSFIDHQNKPMYIPYSMPSHPPPPPPHPIWNGAYWSTQQPPPQNHQFQYMPYEHYYNYSYPPPPPPPPLPQPPQPQPNFTNFVLKSPSTPSSSTTSVGRIIPPSPTLTTPQRLHSYSTISPIGTKNHNDSNNSSTIDQQQQPNYSQLLKEKPYINKGNNCVIWGAFLNMEHDTLHFATGHTFTIGQYGCSYIIDNGLIQGTSCRISSYVSDSSSVIFEAFQPELFKINGKQLQSNRKTLILKSLDEIKIATKPNEITLVYMSSLDLISNKFKKSNNFINSNNNSCSSSSVSNNSNNNSSAFQLPSSTLFSSPLKGSTLSDSNNSTSVSSSTSPVLSGSESNSSFLNINQNIDNKGILVPLPPIMRSTNSNSAEAIQTQDQIQNGDIKRRSRVVTRNALDILLNPIQSSIGSNQTNTTNTTTINNNNNNINNNNNNCVTKANCAFDKDQLNSYFKSLVVNPDDTQFNLDNFPYYLSQENKEILSNTGNFFLKNTEFTKYSNDISSLNKRILIDGPPGSDICQNTLIKAIAKQFNAYLFVLDSSCFEVKFKNPNYVPSSNNIIKTPTSSNTPTTGILNTPTSSNNNINNNSNNNINVIFKTPTNNVNNQSTSSQTPSTIGSTSLDDLEMKPHLYPYTIKSHIIASRKKFQLGDKVKFLPASSTVGTGVSPYTSEYRKLLAPPQSLKGRVVIANDHPNNKVGVKFEKGFVGANNLNGHIQENLGYFANSYDLKLDEYESETSYDYFMVSNLLEYLQKLSNPTILYLKEPEKTILSSYDRYVIFKNEYSKFLTKAPILLMSSTVTTDLSNRRDKSNNIGSIPTFILGNGIGGSGPIGGSAPSSSSMNSSRFLRYLDTPPSLDAASSNIFHSPSGFPNKSNLFDIDRVSFRGGVGGVNGIGGNGTAFDNGNSLTSTSTFATHALPSKILKVLYKLFPNRIVIQPPMDKTLLEGWKASIERDTETLRYETNLCHIKKIFQKNNLAVKDEKDLESLPTLKKQIYSIHQLDQIIGWSLTYTFSTNNNSNNSSNNNDISMIEIIQDRLIIPTKSLQYGISLLELVENSNNPSKPKLQVLKDLEPDNEFEKKLLPEVITPDEISVKFDDIGALDKAKEILRELVMLPLQRPELFRRGNLSKPSKGILLFGPPGTGKTLLAKAVANESGANFINISMSSLGSKWFGEGEKFARAVFTLASKISPCVIFIDEVDSILGKRDKNEHEAMRKIKNEFMQMWDGLKTKENERVLILAATNRPFDIDDAVLRRLSRKLLIDLPDEENRVKILSIILQNECLSEDFDIRAIAKATPGYSGSDLKNLSISAAYQPIRDLLKLEKENQVKGISNEGLTLRPINNQDFQKSLKDISSSVSEDSSSVAELRKWDEMYGESSNGSRKSNIPSYYM